MTVQAIQEPSMISIHAPARGATPHSLSFMGNFGAFQSTLPRGERPELDATLLGNHYFNPRSRAGSDVQHTAYGKYGPISIHAPARGATLMAIYVLWNSGHFNPRSRAGSDAFSIDCKRAS